MIICQKCGSQLPDNVQICPVCNTPTNAQAAAAVAAGETPVIQPTQYQPPDREFMEDTLLGKVRARAKVKPFSTSILVLLGVIGFFILLMIWAIVLDLTDGLLLPITFIAAGLLYILLYAPWLRKKKRGFTYPVTATIVSHVNIRTRHKFRHYNHYHAVYEYEYNGMLVRAMADDEYGSVPETGKQANLLIKPDQPDKLFDLDIEQGRIIQSRISGSAVVLLGVIVLIVFIIL